MGEIILIFLVLAATVVWIEWSPDWHGIIPTYLLYIGLILSGIALLPKFIGWLLLLVGIAGFVWEHHSYKRKDIGPDVLAFVVNILQACFLCLQTASVRSLECINRIATPLYLKWKNSKASRPPVSRFRLWFGIAVLTVSGPFVAILMNLPLASILLSYDVLSGQQWAQDVNPREALKLVAAHVASIWIYTLALIGEEWLILVPIIMASIYLCASHAARAINYMQQLGVSILVMGALYPSIYAIAFIVLGIQKPYVYID